MAHAQLLYSPLDIRAPPEDFHWGTHIHHWEEEKLRDGKSRYVYVHVRFLLLWVLKHRCYKPMINCICPIVLVYTSMSIVTRALCDILFFYLQLRLLHMDLQNVLDLNALSLLHRAFRPLSPSDSVLCHLDKLVCHLLWHPILLGSFQSQFPIQVHFL